MSGAARIFLYNWPTYVGTWTVAVALAVAAAFVRGASGAVLGAAAAVALVWSAASLAVSHYVYDRSPLVEGRWLSSLLPARTQTWATIDAGLDAEVALEEVMPGRCLARLDVYDGTTVRAPSVERARTLTPRSHAATRCPATALALPDASCDVVGVVFTAHEIRDAGAREQFFLDVKRALRGGGRLLLVEHLRDAANFLAFGPGFLHFQPRAEWLRLAGAADFRIAAETRVTPWVMALALEKA